jgi:molybdopterin-guanine dinucleotide biosynthesis protein B
VAPRIISIIGRKNTGKTTLVVALAAEFVRRGKRVMTIKHASHAADLDHPGTDTYRHYHEGKAERVLLATPELRAVIERSPDDTDPITLTRRYLADADLVIVEGFKLEALPKVEVFRKAVASTPIYNATMPNAGEWLAIVTDDAALTAECPVLRFKDTIWLQLVSSLAWDGALQL